MLLSLICLICACSLFFDLHASLYILYMLQLMSGTHHTIFWAFIFVIEIAENFILGLVEYQDGEIQLGK
jgi:hypothetical protein